MFSIGSFFVMHIHRTSFFGFTFVLLPVDKLCLIVTSRVHFVPSIFLTTMANYVPTNINTSKATKTSNCNIRCKRNLCWTSVPKNGADNTVVRKRILSGVYSLLLDGVGMLPLNPGLNYLSQSGTLYI